MTKDDDVSKDQVSAYADASIRCLENASKGKYSEAEQAGFRKRGNELFDLSEKLENEAFDDNSGAFEKLIKDWNSSNAKLDDDTHAHNLAETVKDAFTKVDQLIEFGKKIKSALINPRDQ